MQHLTAPDEYRRADRLEPKELAMGEVFEAPNPASDPECPASSSTPEGESPAPSEELEFTLLEDLAEEETILAPPEGPCESSAPGIGALAATAEAAPLVLN